MPEKVVTFTQIPYATKADFNDEISVTRTQKVQQTIKSG